MRKAALILGFAALAACSTEPFNDQELTGILVSPAPGEWEGPVDLIVRNRTGSTITCDAWETDNCPSLATFITSLSSIADGEEQSVAGVQCTYLDVSCRFPEDGPEKMPVRVWGWSVTPPVEE